MADKPIIFSAPMVRALLDGTKTQTRRLITKRAALAAIALGCPSWLTLAGNADLLPINVRPGDRLWVREAWRADAHWDHVAPSVLGPIDAVQYEADGQRNLSAWGDPFNPGRYRHARFMPRWASRITRTVTDLRVQRLQEISAADAGAEGVTDYQQTGTRIAFARLWDGLHGVNAWAENPWVAAYTFTVARGNIDQMPGVADG